MRRLTFKEYLLLVCAVIFLTFFSLLIYRMLDGWAFNKPLVVESAVVTRKTYHPGSIVRIKITYCKYRELVGVSRWEVIDGVTRPLAWSADHNTYSGPVGCFDDAIITVGKLPKDLATDTYYLSGIINFKIGPLSEVNVPIKTNSFKVIKK